MEFYATLPPGIEDIAAQEVEKFGGKILELRKGKGRIFFKGCKDLIPKLNCLARCLERIVVLMLRGKFTSLNDIYNAIKSIDVYFLDEKSFAIRCTRVGSHNFTSIDVARVSGQAVIDNFMENYGKRLRVNLDEPDVIIRVDVVDNEFFVGIDTTGDDALHKRWWRIYNHPAHLNSTIACAMIKLSTWNDQKSLVDPMCGSGTIPIETALIGRNIPPNKNRVFAYFKLYGEKIVYTKEIKKDLELYGVEKFKKHLDGAKKNAENAGVNDTIKFELSDATELKGDYDCIVTNPPYGLRIARKSVIRRLYEKFCISAKNCMHNESKLVVITAEYKTMENAAKKAGLEVVHSRYVKYGGLLTKIFVFQR